MSCCHCLSCVMLMMMMMMHRHVVVVVVELMLSYFFIGDNDMKEENSAHVEVRGN